MANGTLKVGTITTSTGSGTITNVLPDGIVIVPFTVTVPTNNAFSLPEIVKFVKVWLFLTKKEELRLAALTELSEGVPTV